MGEPATPTPADRAATRDLARRIVARLLSGESSVPYPTPAPRKERPILFSAPMVRAILAGKKTQTRRVMKPQPDVTADHESGGTWQWASHKCKSMVDMREARCLSPYGARGDRLWVRESIGLALSIGDKDCAVYLADNESVWLDTWPWKRLTLPSIHLPRALSRITLDITGVRVERLQAITEGDAKAEGAAWRIDAGGDLHGAFSHVDTPIEYRNHFRDLWTKINGQESWDANPWVWVIEFSRVETP